MVAGFFATVAFFAAALRGGLAAGVPSVDIIDLEYDPWHTQRDTLDAVSAQSLQVVGDVVLAAIPQIEAHFRSQPVRLQANQPASRPRP